MGNLGDIWKEKTGQQPMLVAVTVSQPWAHAHPEVLKRFLLAHKEAVVYLKTHPAVWPEIAKAMKIKTGKGAKLLRERTVSALLTRWDRKFVDQQYAYAADVYRILGGKYDVPKKIPGGTFEMSYTP